MVVIGSAAVAAVAVVGQVVGYFPADIWASKADVATVDGTYTAGNSGIAAAAAAAVVELPVAFLAIAFEK